MSKQQTIKHTHSGKSLLELYKQFGVGSSGFYSKDPWWKDEAFAKEKLEPATYEIDVERKLTGLTFKEQENNLKKGSVILHPTVLAEAILTHFKTTGERVLEDWYQRTSVLDSDGVRVIVGGFDAEGLDVHRWDGSGRSDNIGLASARKLKFESRELETFESSNLELRVKNLEDKMAKIKELL